MPDRERVPLMLIKILDNSARHFLDALGPALEQSVHVEIAVAFASHQGIRLIEGQARKALVNKSKIEFIVGLDMCTTEPEAIELLQDMKDSYPEQVALYCYLSPRRNHIYHPKLYLCFGASSATCIIGSSNLTPGGLKDNIEINVMLVGGLDEEAITDAHESYIVLKHNLGRCFIPDNESIELYRQRYERYRKADRQVTQDPSFKQLTELLEERANHLPRPSISAKDLRGWLKLIYEALPAGEFTNADVYVYEPEFKKVYPGNKTIHDKIRQVLQDLAKIGLIKHIDRGRWRKL
jgi:HKD family nuclease